MLTEAFTKSGLLKVEVLFSGNYSCLVAHFYLKRSVSFHLIQSYLPSILIVAISWVSFWMDIEAVPGRISLGVITLLAVSSQAGQGIVYLPITVRICFFIALRMDKTTKKKSTAKNVSASWKSPKKLILPFENHLLKEYLVSH